MQGWTKVKGGAKHAGVSVRTFRPWLKDGLEHSRLPSGTILISYQAIDLFISKFAVKQNCVDEMVSEIVDELRV